MYLENSMSLVGLKEYRSRSDQRGPIMVGQYAAIP